jgi:hypothetical protein
MMETNVCNIEAFELRDERNCKLQIAKVKVKIRHDFARLARLSICNLQFAICNSSRLESFAYQRS